MNYRFLIGILFLLFSQVAFSQLNKYNLPPNPFYENAKITLTDFSKYEVKNLRFTSDSVCFINKTTLKNSSLMFNKIDYIRVQDGNQALQYAALGGLLMGLIAILNVNNNTNQKMDNQGQIIIGFAISGALVGGLVGLASPKWKTYYINN